MMSQEEVKNKVCMHWSSGFCKESQCNYVHTYEDFYILIFRGRHDGIGNVGTYRDRQGQKGTDKDKQGQAWTDRDK